MNIHEKIKEVAEYFKAKIISGDFEFKSCRDCIATVVIDEKYEFLLWINNDHKEDFSIHFGSMFWDYTSELLRFKTQKERLTGWKQVKPYVEEYKKKVLKREKQKEFNRLKKELENYKKY
jgi:hypothetical protein